MADFTTIPDWLREREQASKRSGSFIITLFVDMVLPHGGSIALSSLVDACILAGISEQTTRSSVNRLIADGWLASEAQGRRSIYRLSEYGLQRWRSVESRIYQNITVPWNGKWLFLFPGSDAPLPVSVVRDLSWTGFGCVSDRMFVRPCSTLQTSCCDEILLKDLPDRVTCFYSEASPCQEASGIKDFVSRTWNLPLVASRYRAFVDRYDALLGSVWAAHRLIGSQAFIIREFLIHDYRRVRLIDPLLPAELLPDDWPGARAFYIAHELYDLLMESSEQYIVETMQGPDGRIPHVEAGFYQRFGGLSRH